MGPKITDLSREAYLRRYRISAKLTSRRPYSPSYLEEAFSEVCQGTLRHSTAPRRPGDPARDGSPILRVGLAKPTTQRRLLVADHEQVEDDRRRPRVGK